MENNAKSMKEIDLISCFLIKIKIDMRCDDKVYML